MVTQLHLQLQFHHPYKFLKEYKLKGGSHDFRETVDKEVFFRGRNSEDVHGWVLDRGPRAMSQRSVYSPRKHNCTAPNSMKKKIQTSFFGTVNTFYYYSRSSCKTFAWLTCRRSVVAAMQDTSLNAQIARWGSDHLESHTIPRSD